MRRDPGAAFTLASAIAYPEALIARGLAFDAFAPRLSFHFATTMDLFEEVAKLRAARRMWYRIATERFGATDANSGRLGSSRGTRAPRSRRNSR